VFREPGYRKIEARGGMMAGTLNAPAEKRSKRTCYSCGNSYPYFFRFCPIDGADLEYLPQPIENLAKDFRQTKNKCKILASAVSVCILAVIAWIVAAPNPVSTSTIQGYGELTVRTTPAGARVYLDGSQVGVSPVRLSDIPTGFHEVRAVCPGYSDGKAHIEIRPSASEKLVWDLSPLPSRKTKDRRVYLAKLDVNDSAAPSSETSARSSI
jgi:hypothetical protein